MNRSGNRRSDNSSKHSVGRLLYLLLDKSAKNLNNDSRETNEISIQTSGSTVNLNNSLREESCVPSHGVNNLFKINTSETSSIDENRNTTNKVAMQESSADDETQCEEDLPTLLNLLKNKYPFRDETNKNILYNYEIHRFTELYNITDFCLVLAYDDLVFWLKDPNGAIYMWSRIDESMILGGRNMKDALINFLFHQENLCYIEEYTHELLLVKKVKEDADKWYEENKNAAIMFVLPNELLPLKKGSKKGSSRKKKDKRKKRILEKTSFTKKDLDKIRTLVYGIIKVNLLKERFSFTPDFFKEFDHSIIDQEFGTKWRSDGMEFFDELVNKTRNFSLTDSIELKDSIRFFNSFIDSNLLPLHELLSLIFHDTSNNGKLIYSEKQLYVLMRFIKFLKCKLGKNFISSSVFIEMSYGHTYLDATLLEEDFKLYDLWFKAYKG